MSLSDFDPLVSPINSGQSAPAASPSPSSAASAGTAAKQPKKFDGVSNDFLYSSKWTSLRASASHSQTLAFCAPKPAVAAHEEDPVDRIQREKAIKEAADREKAERERKEEEARQEEARQAAAAGKEDIGADLKKVDLPGELNGVGGAAPAAAASPIDPAIAKAQADLERQHEKDLAARNRYADRATFRYTVNEGSGAGDLPVLNSTKFTGAFELKGQQIVLSDVCKTVVKAGAEPVKTDISGVSAHETVGFAWRC